MTPLVLLPGMMCDERLFASQMGALSGDRPVHVLPITAHDNVTDLAASVLTEAPDRFALAGLSMGGIVAMEVLRLAPDRVDRLALMDTNPRAENEKIKLARLPQIKRASEGHLDQVMRDEMKPNYLADGPNRAAILDLCMDMAIDLGPTVFERQSQALMQRPDQTETLRGFGRHALVLCGREDTLCPLHRHELMHDLLPNSRLEIIEGAGHLPTLEKPDETTGALLNWLEGP